MPSKDPIHLEQRGAEGAKRFSPTAGRNRGPIGDVLSQLVPEGAYVLEIASGTGEHAQHMCDLRPDITWQTSDPDADSRASQDARAAEMGGAMRSSLDLDVTDTDWTERAGEIDFIYCANMIHIAPWEAAVGLAKGAGARLKAGQICVLYGPFKEGEQTAQSNLDFDVSLKSRNPSWGVRNLDDVKHIFELHGFNMTQRTEMPKNNRILVFKRGEDVT